MVVSAALGAVKLTQLMELQRNSVLERTRLSGVCDSIPGSNHILGIHDVRQSPHYIVLWLTQ